MNLEDPKFRDEIMGRLDAVSALDDPQERANIMAQLDAATSPTGVALDVVHSIPEGFNRGLAGVADTYVMNPYRAVEKGIRSGINWASNAMGYGDVVTPTAQTPTARELSDRIGTTGYTPQTRAGQYTAAVTQGIGEAAPFAAAGVANPAVWGTIGQNVAVGAGSGLGTQVAKDTGHSELAGALVGGLGAQGVTTATTKALNAATGAGKPSLLADFDAAGVTPRLPGNVTESPTWGRVQSALGSVGYKDIFSAARGEVDDLARRADDLAAGLGTGRTIDDAGTNLIQGAQNFRSGWETESRKLYDDFANRLPLDTKVKVGNTLDVLAGTSRQFPDAPATGQLFESPLYRDLLNSLGMDAVGGEISLQSLKSARSKVGELLSNPVAHVDADRADLNRLYAALSQDLEGAAVKAGPDALKAFQAANTHFRDGMTQIEGPLARLLDPQANAVTAYQHAMGQARQGAERLSQIKGSMSAPEWDNFVASEVHRMGQATPGTQNAAGDLFSPNSFLTNYNKLTRSGAADVLFDSALRPDLDRLARITESMRESKKLWNHSGTAGSNFWLGLLQTTAAGGGGGAAVGLPGGGALAAASTFLSGKLGAALFTRPEFVRWLATSAEDTAMTSQGVLAGLVRFAAQSGTGPDVAQEAAQKIGAAVDYLTRPTDGYLDKLNAYAKTRQGGPVDPQVMNDTAGTVQRVAPVDPVFADELQKAAAQSPGAYRALLYKALQDPARRQLAEQALKMGRQ